MTSHPNRSRKVKTLRRAETLRGGSPLLELWLELMGTFGHGPQAAVNDVNAAVQGRHTLSRMGEWRRGVYRIPRDVEVYMRKCVIEMALERSGVMPTDAILLVEDERLEKLAELLS